MQKYNVYCNILIKGYSAYDTGNVSFDLIKQSSTCDGGYTQWDSTLVGVLIIADDWKLTISQLGTPLLKDSKGTLVQLDRDESISKLNRYEGIRYVSRPSLEAIDFYESEEWIELNNQFIILTDSRLAY